MFAHLHTSTPLGMEAALNTIIQTVGERFSKASRWAGDTPFPQGLQTFRRGSVPHLVFNLPVPYALSTCPPCDKDVLIPASARQMLGHPVGWLATQQEESDLQWIEGLHVYKAYP